MGRSNLWPCSLGLFDGFSASYVALIQPISERCVAYHFQVNSSKVKGQSWILGRVCSMYRICSLEVTYRVTYDVEINELFVFVARAGSVLVDHWSTISSYSCNMIFFISFYSNSAPEMQRWRSKQESLCMLLPLLHHVVPLMMGIFAWQCWGAEHMIC